MTLLGWELGQESTWLSWDISETLYGHGQSDSLLTWLQNIPVCWTVISVPWSPLLIVVRLPQTAQWSHWEVQFHIPDRKLSISFGEGFLDPLGPTHSFSLYPPCLNLISQSNISFGISALSVVTVGAFWCLLPLFDIFMFSFYMLQNCCLGFGKILNLYQFFSNSLTDWGQEVPGSECIISLPFLVIPFLGTSLPSWTEVFCVTPNLC